MKKQERVVDYILRTWRIITFCVQEFGADVITDDLSEYIAIALLLVSERAKGDESFWKSYIGVLPTVEDVSRRPCCAENCTRGQRHIVSFFCLFVLLSTHVPSWATLILSKRRHVVQSFVLSKQPSAVLR